MNIVYLTTEAVPFAKTGGLADVCGTLPSEVAALGHDCAVIMPAFASIHRTSQTIEPTSLSFAIPMGESRVIGCRVLKSTLPVRPSDNDDQDGPVASVPVYFIDQPQYYDRPSLYGDATGDYHDNAERFAFFCRAALVLIEQLRLDVDVLHCNDWQTGLIPALCRIAADEGTSPQSVPRTVFTIHNLAYQGHFPADAFRWTNLDWQHFNQESFEFFGGLNFLKTGLITADMITTVSPTYAEEIRTPQNGCGLDGILQTKRDRSRGIINGIDTHVWNPSLDPKLSVTFDETTWQQGKRDNKLALQAEVGLPQDEAVPLIGLVGRLADQKGWDLILPVLRRHVYEGRPTQWIILGSGDPTVEASLRELATLAPNQLATYIGFSDALAHRIEAASDLFVMPSRYEPCGLNQLYSLRYGTPCVVTKTGGLADTIVDTTERSIEDGTANGFHLSDYTVDSLDQAIGNALRIRHHEKNIWKKIIEHGMAQDWSWRKSAAQYVQLYERTASLSRYRVTPSETSRV